MRQRISYQLLYYLGFCHCAKTWPLRCVERKLSYLGCSENLQRWKRSEDPGTRDGEGTKHGNIISQQYSRTLCRGSGSSLEVALWKSSCYEQLPCGAVTDVFWCVGTPNSTILCRNLEFFDFPKTCTIFIHKERNRSLGKEDPRDWWLFPMVVKKSTWKS